MFKQFKNYFKKHSFSHPVPSSPSIGAVSPLLIYWDHDLPKQPKHPKRHKLFRRSNFHRLLASILAITILITSIRIFYFKPPAVRAADVIIGMNEGYGTSSAVHDTNSTLSAGSITGAVWKTEDLCKFGKCLFFDGDGDYVSFADDDDLDFAQNESFTLEAWIRHAPKTTGTDVIISKLLDSDNDGGYRLKMESDGDITCEIEDNDADATIDDSVTSTAATYDDNQWHHLACVKSGTSSLTLYIDANQINQDASLDSTSTYANNESFYIGMDADGTSNDYTDFIDEVKVYRSARSAGEIKADFGGVTASSGTAASFAPDQSYTSNGLIGYWNMELSGSAGTNGGPTNIDNASDFGYNSGTVVRTSGGTLYAFLREYDAIFGSNCEIWKSTNGTSWSQQQSGTSLSCNSADAAIDSNQDIYAIYARSESSAGYVFRRIYHTSSDTWDEAGEEMIFSDSGSDQNDVSGLVTIDSNNVAHYLFYFGYTEDLQNLCHLEYDGPSSGYTFYSYEYCNGLALQEFIIDDDNIPIVLLYENFGDLNAYRGNQNDATSFTPTTVDATVYSAVGASIATDSSGNIWISYLDLSTQYVRLIEHHYGDNWSTWQSSVTNSNVGTATSLATNGSDIYVFYEDDLHDIVYDKYSGSWAGQTTLQTGNYQYVKSKWANYYNYQESTQIDYLYDDGTDDYWASLSLTAANNLADSSGNNLTLTNSGSTTFVNGKFATGSEHVPGSFQFLSYASTISGVKSVSFWVNPDSTTNYYLSLTSNDYITSTEGTISVTGFGSNEKIYVNGIETTTVTQHVWQLVTVTTDTAINASQLYIGRVGSNYFDGTLDEVRLYNRNLTPAEVQKLYNWAPGPAGYWKLDEQVSGDGKTVYDSSGNDNSGTTYDGANNKGMMCNTSGKFGAGCEFDGDDYITVADSSDFQVDDSNNFTAMFWTYSNDWSPGTIDVFYRRESYTYMDWGITTHSGEARLYIGESNADNVFSADSVSLSNATWQHIAFTKEGNTYKLYLNGVLRSTDTSSQTWTSDQDFTFGNDQPGDTSGLRPSGKLDEIKIYNYVRSPGQIIEDMNAGHPAPGSPVGSAVGWWKLDEGYSTTANDSGYGDNDLTLSTASWTDGKFNKAFAGASNYRLSVGDTPDLDFAADDDLTLSAWFRRATIANQEYLIYKENGFEGYTLYLDSDGDVVFGIGDTNSASFPEETIGGSLSKNYDDSYWHHAVAVKNGTASIKLYVDGKEIASDTSLAVDATLENAGTFYLADANAADGTDEFLGTIDEVSIFRSALTPDQINVLSNQSSAAVMGQDKENITGELTNGLVGYWKMDEVSWTTDCVTDSALDSSGNVNHGDSCPAGSGPAGGAVGKYGRAGDFEADSGQNIFIGDKPSLDVDAENFTVAAWVKLESIGTDRCIVCQGDTGGAIILQYDHGDAKFEMMARDSGGWQYAKFDQISPPSLDTWYHVVGVRSGSKLNIYVNGVLGTTEDTIDTILYMDSQPWGIGILGDAASDHRYFDGIIDDVRIYNRALSPAEVRQLADWAPGPVGYYKFDENSGTTAYDSSGKDHSGTLGDGTATYRPIWSTGKYGGALHFDGTDDRLYISETSDHEPPYNMTIEAWVYTERLPSEYVNDALIMGKRNSISPNNSWYISLDYDASGNTNDSFRFGWINSSGTAYGVTSYSSSGGGIQVQKNIWQHVAAVRDGASLKVYVNGINTTKGSTFPAAGETLFDSNDATKIGSVGSNNNHLGSIDDVRVYNYARTPAQIIEDMNAGHPAPGSPVGSAVAEWKFDEGALNTCSGGVNDFCDSSINANNLAFSTTTGGFTNSGKFGKAFNGTNAVWASKSDDSDFDVTATDDYSISLWYKGDNATNPSTTEYLVNKANATTAGYAIYANNSDQLCFGIDDDTSWGPDIASCTTSDVYDTSWHHLVAVRDYSLTDKTYIYIDGILKDSDSDTTTDSLANGLYFYLADRDGTDNGDEFTGDLDDVKIYRSALTADQVKVLYNQNSAVALGVLSSASSSATMTSSARSYCPPADTTNCNPPVAHWMMDENTGQSVYNVSGNGLTGYLGWDTGISSNDPTWTTGKLGSALYFDGTDDRVRVPDNDLLTPANDMTIEAWVYPTKLASEKSVEMGIVFTKHTLIPYNSFWLSINYAVGGTANDAIEFAWYDSGGTKYGTYSYNSGAGTQIQKNTWQHIVGVREGASVKVYINGVDVSTNTTNPDENDTLYNGDSGMWFGGYSANYIQGSIDDIRLYDYARTSTQISWDYNSGPP